MCKRDKLLSICSRNHNSHALLRLTNCKFRSVQTIILFGDRIKIDQDTVSKLPNSDRNTSGTKIIAALY